MLAASAIDLIGNTPLLALDRVHRGRGRIVANAEFLQPGGSVKDRTAKAILLAARADGCLKPSTTVVEMMSGGMGAGLAVVPAVLGHKLIVTMSAGNSPARAEMLEGLGAEVIPVAQIDGSPGQVTGLDVEAAAEAARETLLRPIGHHREADQANMERQRPVQVRHIELWDWSAHRAFTAALIDRPSDFASRHAQDVDLA